MRVHSGKSNHMDPYLNTTIRRLRRPKVKPCVSAYKRVYTVLKIYLNTAMKRFKRKRSKVKRRVSAYKEYIQHNQIST